MTATATITVKRPANDSVRLSISDETNQLDTGKRPAVLSIQTAARRNRKAFAITDTELRLIAAAAIMGLSSSPNHG